MTLLHYFQTDTPGTRSACGTVRFGEAPKPADDERERCGLCSFTCSTCGIPVRLVSLTPVHREPRTLVNGLHNGHPDHNATIAHSDLLTLIRVSREWVLS